MYNKLDLIMSYVLSIQVIANLLLAGYYYILIKKEKKK